MVYGESYSLAGYDYANITGITLQLEGEIGKEGSALNGAINGVQYTYAMDMLVYTKADDGTFHGFGVKSMRLIAEKYGGRLTVDVDGDMFNLGIYLLAG